MSDHSEPAGLDDFINSPSPSPSSAPKGNEPPGLDQFIQQAQYGGAGNQALAGLAAAGRGATLGLSDVALRASGLVKPETLTGLQEANPITSVLGNIAGSAGLIAATGGLAAPVEGLALGATARAAGASAAEKAIAEGATSAAAKAIGSQAAQAAAGTARAVGSHVLGMTAEGGVLGLGNAISDEALGDGNLNGQKIIADIGMGAALGGGLGLLSKAVGALPALMRGAKATEAAIPGEAAATGAAGPLVQGTEIGGITSGGAAEPIVDIPKSMGQPKSLEEMDKILNDAKKYGNQAELNELPQKAEVLDANSRIGDEMQFPLTQAQLDSLNSQDARLAHKTDLEVPGKGGETLRNWNGAQKKDLIRILDNSIESVAPGYQATTDAAEAGERAAESFTKTIQETRDALSPALEAIKELPGGKDVDHMPGVIEHLTNPEVSPYANPKLANMFDTEASELTIKPFSRTMGIAKKTYQNVSELVAGLKEAPEDFKTLFDLRKGLTDGVNIFESGDASKELTSAKAAMMDYLQNTAQKMAPDLQVRDIFKRWAINEQNAQLIEKKFGAEIGSENWRSLAKGKAEESIIKKIFRDSATVEAAKNILPPEAFNKMLADHLSILRNDATDKGVFSSNKFFTKLKGNQYSLNEAFGSDPAQYQRMKDALTVMRIFADDAPANPSGTTKTLLQALMNGGLDPFAHLKELGEFGKNKLAEMKLNQEINQKLAGTAEKANQITAMKSILDKVNDKIASGAKGIFSTGGKSAALAGAVNMSDSEYNKSIEKVKALSSDPSAMMDHLSKNTDSLYAAAPNITQGIHNTVIQGVQFLDSKIPRSSNDMPLSKPFEPSAMQKNKFGRYYAAVNNPVGALKDVKHGFISNETMEALQAVHPQMLQEMRSQVMNNLNLDKAKNMPYKNKIALSKFLGQPMDGNLMPNVIMGNQMALNGPNMSQQGGPKQGRKASLVGMRNMKPGERAATETNDQEEV